MFDADGQVFGCFHDRFTPLRNLLIFIEFLTFILTDIGGSSTKFKKIPKQLVHFISTRLTIIRIFELIVTLLINDGAKHSPDYLKVSTTKTISKFLRETLINITYLFPRF